MSMDGLTRETAILIPQDGSVTHVYEDTGITVYYKIETIPGTFYYLRVVGAHDLFSDPLKITDQDGNIVSDMELYGNSIDAKFTFVATGDYITFPLYTYYVNTIGIENVITYAPMPSEIEGTSLDTAIEITEDTPITVTLDPSLNGGGRMFYKMNVEVGKAYHVKTPYNAWPVAYIYDENKRYVHDFTRVEGVDGSWFDDAFAFYFVAKTSVMYVGINRGGSVSSSGNTFTMTYTETNRFQGSDFDTARPLVEEVEDVYTGEQFGLPNFYHLEGLQVGKRYAVTIVPGDFRFTLFDANRNLFNEDTESYYLDISDYDDFGVVEFYAKTSSIYVRLDLDGSYPGDETSYHIQALESPPLPGEAVSNSLDIAVPIYMNEWYEATYDFTAIGKQFLYIYNTIPGESYMFEGAHTAELWFLFDENENNEPYWETYDNDLYYFEGDMMYFPFVATGTKMYVVMQVSGGFTSGKADLYFRVTGESADPPKEVSINKLENTTVKKGRQIQLTWETINEEIKNVTWTSSDTSVATVDENGLVTTHKYGKVRISATASTGATDSITISSTHWDSDGEYFLVSTPEELMLIDEDHNTQKAKYKQVRDIDMTNVVDFKPIGIVDNIDGGEANSLARDMDVSSEPVSGGAQLNGFEYNGQNFKIKNLTIYESLNEDDRDYGNLYAGLFTAIRNGKISNTHLVNVNIKSMHKTCGSLVGEINNTAIENCTVKKVEITGLQSTVGGLVGIAYANCSLKNCHVYNFDFIGRVVDPDNFYYTNRLGGLVGYVAEYYGWGGE